MPSIKSMPLMEKTTTPPPPTNGLQSAFIHTSRGKLWWWRQ